MLSISSRHLTPAAFLDPENMTNTSPLPANSATLAWKASNPSTFVVFTIILLSEMRNMDRIVKTADVQKRYQLQYEKNVRLHIQFVVIEAEF